VRKRAETLKLAAIAALWLLSGRVLPDIVWRALPDAVLDTLSLPAYSMLCQVGTTLIGLGAARLFLARPAEALGLSRPSGWHLAIAAFLAPAVFVVASFVAIQIAEPYLVAELAREGAGASRRNAGAFGRALTQAPLFVTLAWGAVLAPLAEELAFRGALFAALEKGATALFARRESHEEIEASPERVLSTSSSGWLAALLSAVAFGAMHADMKGSVGIVRVASVTCLGLACGSARVAAGTVFVPMILHFVYNCVSLGLSRGKFFGDSDPPIWTVLALASVGVVLAIAIAVARRASRGDT
jgi:membrane protease YdiL (CAAX protease family)